MLFWTNWTNKYDFQWIRHTALRIAHSYTLFGCATLFRFVVTNAWLRRHIACFGYEGFVRFALIIVVFIVVFIDDSIMLSFILKLSSFPGMPFIWEKNKNKKKDSKNKIQLENEPLFWREPSFFGLIATIIFGLIASIDDIFCENNLIDCKWREQLFDSSNIRFTLNCSVMVSSRIYMTNKIIIFIRLNFIAHHNFELFILNFKLFRINKTNNQSNASHMFTMKINRTTYGKWNAIIEWILACKIYGISMYCVSHKYVNKMTDTMKKCEIFYRQQIFSVDQMNIVVSLWLWSSYYHFHIRHFA